MATANSSSRQTLLVEENGEAQDTPRSSHALNMELRDALSDLPGVGIMSRCVGKNSSRSRGGLGQKKRTSSLSTTSSRDLQGLLLQYQTESEGSQDRKDNWNSASADAAMPATTSNLFGTSGGSGGGNDYDFYDFDGDGGEGGGDNDGAPSGEVHSISQKSITNMKLKDKVTKRISAKDQLAIDKLHQAAGKNLTAF